MSLKLREYVENHEAAIKNGRFGSLTARLFVKNLKEVEEDDFNTLTNEIYDKLANHEIVDKYVLDGGGSYDLDSAFDYCINEISVAYIEGKMSDFFDEDEAEVVDYAAENPKTVREVM